MVQTCRAEAPSAAQCLSAKLRPPHQLNVCSCQPQLSRHLVLPLKQAYSPCLQEKGNSNAQWWQQQLLGRLGSTGGSWMHVGLRQLSGMLIMVFALTSLQVGSRV